MQDEKNLENQEVEETSNVSVPSEEVTEQQETVTVSAPSKEVSEQATEKIVNVAPKTAHDDFDWNQGKRQSAHYSPEERKTLSEKYEAAMNTINNNEVVQAMVTAIHGGDVVLDINYKSDGLLSLSEFRDMPDLKVGD